MENENRKAYSEVIEILKWLDDEKKLEALPIEMLEVIKSKADPEYKPQISKEIPLEEQDLEKETFVILSWIATKYWNTNIEEKDIKNENESNLKEVEIDNSKVVDENNEGFTHEDDSINNKNCEDSNKLPVLKTDLTWYQKIKNIIVEFFNKIFRKKINNNVEERSEK